MDEVWRVPKAAPAEIMEWLAALAATARAEQTQQQFRSQAPVTDAVAVRPADLPLPSRSRAMAAGAIYARPPRPHLPFGEVLVLVLVEPEPPLEVHVAGRPLRVEIATDPRFALVGDEVSWLFGRRFPRAQQIAPGRRSNTLLTINRIAGMPEGGAPVLACNLWLEEQLVRLENPAQFGTLYKPWLERYVATRGAEPAEPRRSFRAAVAGCERRLRRRGVRPLREWRESSARGTGMEPGMGGARPGKDYAGREGASEAAG